MSYVQGHFGQETGIAAAYPIVLILTAPTLLIRAFMIHKWGVWAAMVAGGVAGVPYYYWLNQVFRPPTFHPGQEGQWDMATFVFAGVAAGAAWWWVEWKLR